MYQTMPATSVSISCPFYSPKRWRSGHAK